MKFATFINRNIICLYFLSSSSTCSLSIRYQWNGGIVYFPPTLRDTWMFLFTPKLESVVKGDSECLLLRLEWKQKWGDSRAQEMFHEEVFWAEGRKTKEQHGDRIYQGLGSSSFLNIIFLWQVPHRHSNAPRHNLQVHNVCIAPPFQDSKAYEGNLNAYC